MKFWGLVDCNHFPAALVPELRYPLWGTGPYFCACL